MSCPPSRAYTGPARAFAAAWHLAASASRCPRGRGAGCHNINLVTPEHVAPQVVEALAIASDYHEVALDMTAP